MTDDLKPCPFCGAKAKLMGGPLAQEFYSVWCTSPRGKRHYIECGTMDEEKAIAEWNTRADLRPTAVPLCVDTLAQIIREVDGNHTLGASELAARILSALDLAPVTRNTMTASEAMAETKKVHAETLDYLGRNMEHVTPAQAAIERAQGVIYGIELAIEKLNTWEIAKPFTDRGRDDDWRFRAKLARKETHDSVQCELRLLCDDAEAALETIKEGE